MRLFLILTCLTLINCTNQKAVSTSEKATEPENNSTVENEAKVIEFTILKEGTNSGYKTSENKEINSIEELSQVWKVLFENYMQKPPSPRVDFRTHKAILVTMGEQTSGGYVVNVKSITSSKKECKVLVNEKKPGASCMTTSVMTYPYQLIMLPKTDAEINFERKVVTYDCEK